MITAIIQPKLIARFVLRKRTFEAHSSEEIKAILDALRAEKYTGPVVIDMAQGGVRSMTAEDRAILST